MDEDIKGLDIFDEEVAEPTNEELATEGGENLEVEPQEEEGLEISQEEEEVETEETEETEGGENLEVEPQVEAPRKSGFQTRVDKLNAKNRKIQEEKERLDRAIAALASEDVSYDPSQYETQEEAEDAKFEYLANKALVAREERQRAQLEEQAEQIKAEQFKEVFKSATAKYARLPELLKQEIPVNHHIEEAILESGNAEELVYYFASNPNEAELVCGMTDRQAIIRLHQIEEKIKQKIAQKSNKVKQSTQPTKPRQTNSSSVTFY